MRAVMHASLSAYSQRCLQPLQVVDPPLLRLETEAAHAYLSVLLHISTSSHDPNTTTVCNATQRLMMLCLSTLSR